MTNPEESEEMEIMWGVYRSEPILFAIVKDGEFWATSSEEFDYSTVVLPR